jgi:hypothetical protein
MRPRAFHVGSDQDRSAGRSRVRKPTASERRSRSNARGILDEWTDEVQRELSLGASRSCAARDAVSWHRRLCAEGDDMAGRGCDCYRRRVGGWARRWRIGSAPRAPMLLWQYEALTSLPRRLTGSKPRVAQRPPSPSTSHTTAYQALRGMLAREGADQSAAKSPVCRLAS